MVKYLLDSANSMDLNCQDNYGNTPLHAACEDGSIDVAKVLITAGKVRFNWVESLLGWLHLFSHMGHSIKHISKVFANSEKTTKFWRKVPVDLSLSIGRFCNDFVAFINFISVTKSVEAFAFS